MNIQNIILWDGVLLGLLATALFDGWLWLQKQLGGRTLNFAYLGRWIGHFRHLKFIHAQIGQAPAITNEWLIGVAGHYAIGILIAALLLLAGGSEWMRHPQIGTALLVGILTVVFPLLIMQPGMGGGIAFSHTPQPWINSLKSLLNHTMFGLCLYVAGVVMHLLR